MLLGMSLSTFTLVHVIISLAGLGSGFIVLYGLLNSKRLDGWTAIFLTTTVLTSVTGFMFPFEGFKPSYVFGVLSLIVLAIAIWARYSRHLEGSARGIYVVTAGIALYLNCFVAVVQSFLKIPALHALAPTATTEPIFLAAETLVLAAFIWLTYRAAKRFHLEAARAT
ncbi:MAG TPA: hypothetical protein VE779_05845 [Candidatus Angelobacter sp.]|nr:hypothetical protein [Candidatus Angelobacter sp.]